MIVTDSQISVIQLRNPNFIIPCSVSDVCESENFNIQTSLFLVRYSNVLNHMSNPKNIES